MDSLEKILETYSDEELAAVWFFKKEKYTAITQKKIETYILDNRKISVRDLQKIFSKLPNKKISKDKTLCPRCGSIKLLCYDVSPLAEFVTANNKGNIEVVCAICDFVIEDPYNRLTKRKWFDLL